MNPPTCDGPLTTVAVPASSTVTPLIHLGMRSIDSMSARQQLNQFHVAGSLLVAALLGLATSSWSAFMVALAALIGVGCLGGAIRPARRGR